MPDDSEPLRAQRRRLPRIDASRNRHVGRTRNSTLKLAMCQDRKKRSSQQRHRGAKTNELSERTLSALHGLICLWLDCVSECVCPAGSGSRVPAESGKVSASVETSQFVARPVWLPEMLCKSLPYAHQESALSLSSRGEDLHGTFNTFRHVDPHTLIGLSQSRSRSRRRKKSDSPATPAAVICRARSHPVQSGKSDLA